MEGVAADFTESGLRGAVWGLVSRTEAAQLTWDVAHRRASTLPERPWVAIAHFRGKLVASCSPMLPSGIFWGFDGQGRLRLASDPVRIARAGGSRGINDDHIRQYLFGVPPAESTAFQGVSRLQSGYWVEWTAADQAPREIPWCGPEVWQGPHLVGDEAVTRFIAAFDEVVQGLLPYVGTSVVALSGGLDSTFLASAVARAYPQRPTLALHSAPLQVPGLYVTVGRDADETQLAAQMAQLCGFDLQVVTNHGLTRPLAAAAAAQARSGVPTYAPANQIWIDEFDRIAQAVGARAWFTGWHGNASFSYGHPYVQQQRSQMGRVAAALGWQRPGWAQRHSTGVSGRSAAAPVRSLPGVPERRVPHSRLSGRERWLHWLAFRGRGLAAARNPAAGGGGVVCVDPYAAPSVLAVAAAIEPAQWRSPGVSRAFARRAGRGRVPDTIRLRTRRGRQSADAWWVIRNDREDYLDRIVGLHHLPGFEQVDIPTLTQHVGKWPWGEPLGPPREEYATLDRILAAGHFVTQFRS